VSNYNQQVFVQSKALSAIFYSMGGINTGLLVVRIEVLKGGIPCIGYRGKCDTNRLLFVSHHQW